MQDCDIEYCCLQQYKEILDLDLNIFQNHKYRLNNKDKTITYYNNTFTNNHLCIFRFKDRIKKQISFIVDPLLNYCKFGAQNK